MAYEPYAAKSRTKQNDLSVVLSVLLRKRTELSESRRAFESDHPDLASLHARQTVGGLAISVPHIGAILDGQLVARMSDERTGRRVISARG